MAEGTAESANESSGSLPRSLPPRSSEIAALAAMEEQEREQIIERAVAGEGLGKRGFGIDFGNLA